MASVDSSSPGSALFWDSRRNRVRKYGRMANTSITFIGAFKNFHLPGEQANRRMYSRVNHVMQIASTMANLGLSDWLPFASVTETEGIVLSVRAIVETTMKDTEITATTYWVVMVTN